MEFFNSLLVWYSEPGSMNERTGHSAIFFTTPR